MNDKQEVDVMTQFLASIEGGEQAEKQTVLFALDNHADDASASMRPTTATSLRSPAPSSRRRNAPPVSPRSLSCSACDFAAARCPYVSPPATRPPTEPTTASRPGGRSRSRLELAAQDVVRHVRLGVGESQRSAGRGARVRRARLHLRRGTSAISVGTRSTEPAAALDAACGATPDAGCAVAHDATPGRRASVRLQSAWRGLAQRCVSARLLLRAEQAEAERLGSELTAERPSLATSALLTELAAARDATPDAERGASPDAAPGSTPGSTPDAGPPAAPGPGLCALLKSQLLRLLNGARGRSRAQWDRDAGLLFAGLYVAGLFVELGPVLTHLADAEKLRRSISGLSMLPRVL